MNRKSLINLLYVCTILFSLLLPGCVVVSIGCDSCMGLRMQHQKEVQIDQPMEPNGRLSAQTNDGGITVIGNSASNRCKVDAVIIAWAESSDKAREICEKSELVLENIGNKYNLKLNKPILNPCQSVDVELNIDIPSACDLHLRSDDGKVIVETVYGAMDISADDGNITLNNFGRDNAKIVLRTDDGSIRATNGGDDFDVSADDGRITLDNIYGNCKAHTDDGGIFVRYNPNAKDISSISLGADDGRIELNTPTDFSAQVLISTDNGPITTDLPIMIKGEVKPNHIKGTIGDGEGKLTISTDDGSVIVR